MNIDLMDYFAAKAMQSLLNNKTVERIAEEEKSDFPSLIASMSYDMAICMLNERKHLMDKIKNETNH